MVPFGNANLFNMQELSPTGRENGRQVPGRLSTTFAILPHPVGDHVWPCPEPVSSHLLSHLILMATSKGRQVGGGEESEV